MGLNLVDRKQFAKKKIYGSQYLLEPQDKNEPMGPTYHLNRFEE